MAEKRENHLKRNRRISLLTERGKKQALEEFAGKKKDNLRAPIHILFAMVRFCVADIMLPVPKISSMSDPATFQSKLLIDEVIKGCKMQSALDLTDEHFASIMAQLYSFLHSWSVHYDSFST
jgi:hypothetical protein